MNGNCSTTGPKSPERLPDTDRLEYQWKLIDWKKAEAEVNRLQARIAKATQEKKWNTVKRLQYLLTHSYYAKVLAVRKVTMDNAPTMPREIIRFACMARIIPVTTTETMAMDTLKLLS